MNIEYTCKNEECQHEFPVQYYYGSGCLQEECPKCGWQIDVDEIEERMKPEPEDHI